ncbi:hypothetical protein ACVIKP_000963 [Rhizobium leguminosarum]
MAASAMHLQSQTPLGRKPVPFPKPRDDASDSLGNGYRGFGTVFIIIDRHPGFQRRQDKGLPHRLGRHPSGKPGAAEIDRPLLMDAAIDRPV